MAVAEGKRLGKLDPVAIMDEIVKSKLLAAEDNAAALKPNMVPTCRTPAGFCVPLARFTARSRSAMSSS